MGYTKSDFFPYEWGRMLRSNLNTVNNCKGNNVKNLYTYIRHKRRRQMSREALKHKYMNHLLKGDI